MNLIEIFSIIFIHWIADFVLQTDKQAKGKSQNWSDLIDHTAIYSLTWYIPIHVMLIIKGVDMPLMFSFYFVSITFVLHTITDYFTSRLNRKLWQQGKVHNFFVSIGFDQILHYVQLFSTYYLLKG